MSELLLGLVYLLLLFIIIIINILLRVGFQKTIHLTGKKRQSPMVLLRNGWHFFGRMFKVGLILLPIYGLLIWLTFLIVKKATLIDTNFLKTAQSSPFLYQICFVVPGFILIKLILLMPTLIIVLDCQVFQSFKFLKKIRLFDAKELLAIFFDHNNNHFFLGNTTKAQRTYKYMSVCLENYLLCFNMLSQPNDRRYSSKVCDLSGFSL